MARYLMTIEDTFTITGRGTVVTPAPDLPEHARGSLKVELRRPDGSRETAGATVMVAFDLRADPLLIRLPKDRIPVGTEVWLIEDDGLAGHP